VSSLLLRGFALGFAIAASPGPIFFLCARRTLVQGRLYGLASGFGVATADGFYAAIATFSVAALTSVFVSAHRPLAAIGGTVLLMLGFRTLLERPATAGASKQPSAGGLALAYVSTLGLTITNPATIISFAALAASLGLGTNGSLVKPAEVTFGVLLGSAAWWCLLAVGLAFLRTRMTPGVVRGISVFSGLAIVALGILAVVSAFTG
jgi:threonine/homoserine/homoserine lactone efflux protein